jgi:hypothetical protein
MAASCAVLLALLTAGCGGSDSSSTADATEASTEKRGMVRVEWEEPMTEEDELGYELLEAGETEEIISGLAESFELPNRLLVQGINGIEGGPAYYPEDNAIVLPYQFATMVLGVMAESSPEASEEEIGEQAGSVNSFILAHEFAHAMIENLDIPIFGREEDAADSISTALLLEVPNGDEYAANAALFWAELASEGGHSLEEYADEHSLNIQRALNRPTKKSLNPKLCPKRGWNVARKSTNRSSAAWNRSWSRTWRATPTSNRERLAAGPGDRATAGHGDGADPGPDRRPHRLGGGLGR